MSKNITIQEGGVAKSLTADKLKTDLVGGGTCNWVLEDETQLITKSVTKNGTYKASSDGAYGYSKVVVNVAGGGSVSGKGSDGNTHNYSTDDQGNIVDEVIPDTIVVTTPPTNPYGIYQNGQTITTEGMVVKAYDGDGTEYGTVPLDEITISPTTAVYDPNTDTPAGKRATSDIQTSLPQPISFTTECSMDTVNWGVSGVRGDAAFFSSKDEHGGVFVAVSKTSNGIEDAAMDGNYIPVLPTNVTLAYTYDNKPVYMYKAYAYNQTVKSTSGIDYSGQNVDGPSMWTMLYGTIEDVQAGSRQTITVTWPRPGDGKELTTTFEILVAPGYTPGGGSTVENGHGGGGGSF